MMTPRITTAAPHVAGYRVLYRLGAGGMGEVWRADRAPVLGVSLLCALKVLPLRHGRNPDYLKRLAREANVGLDISGDHPNLVTTRELAIASDGRVVLVMDLVRGPRLDHLVQRLSGDFPRIRFIAEQCFLALGYLESKEVVHGDLSPTNILIGSDGAAKLSDFGLARFRDLSSASIYLFGTPPYESLEALLKGQTGSAASDRYSLGAVLYELITGRPPHGRGTLDEVAEEMERVQKKGCTVRQLPVDTPDDLRQISRASSEWQLYVIESDPR